MSSRRTTTPDSIRILPILDYEDFRKIFFGHANNYDLFALQASVEITRTQFSRAHHPPNRDGNQGSLSHFNFKTVLGPDVTQENVFIAVCTDVIESVLRGVNGTIFAYGQTGSGKTYTMTGSTDSYSQRGLIPRCLEKLFSHTLTTTPRIDISVSYVEIYNEEVFDLLCTVPKNESFHVTRIFPYEDNDGRVEIRGMTQHTVHNVAQALALLFKGDACRVVAETSMNNCSTRSHCIFNIHVGCSHNSGQSGTECVLRLVDLAGSERLGHSEMGTVLFNEGRNINLSLHYLEQVIVALNERVSNKRRHIPYRNSVLTWILRDSLGGNCSTSMIANISTDDDCFGESLSTCRFAKRVSSVENGATVNEVVDPQKIIAQLTGQVEYLRKQLESVQNSPVLESTLTDSELDTLKTDIEKYLRGPESLEFNCGNLRLAQASWKIFHRMYNSLPHVSHVTGVNKFDHHVNASSTEKQVINLPNFEQTRSQSPRARTYAQQLKLMCARGQLLAHHAGELREEISKLKNNALLDVPESRPDEESISLRRNLLAKHAEYNSVIGELKGLKIKIEGVQNQIRLHGPDSSDVNSTTKSLHSN